MGKNDLLGDRENIKPSYMVVKILIWILQFYNFMILPT